jgi:ketosteroid isomerase-like protein
MKVEDAGEKRALAGTVRVGHDWPRASANADVVRALLDTFNRHDLDGILRCLDPDVVYEMGADDERSASPEAAEPARGHAQIVAFYEHMWPVIEDARAEPLEVVEDGDRVIAMLAMSGRLVHTGLVSRWRDRHVCTLRDGKIAHYEIHTERGQARQTLN